MSFRIDGLAAPVGAKPNLSRARELRRGMDARLLESLLSILTRISDRSNVDCSPAIDRISMCRDLLGESEKKKLSYLAYALHWTLKKVITSRDFDRLPFIVDQFE